MEITLEKMLTVFENQAALKSAFDSMNHILLGDGQPGEIANLNGKLESMKEDAVERHQALSTQVAETMDALGRELKVETAARNEQHAVNTASIAEIKKALYGTKRFIAGVILAVSVIFETINQVLNHLIPYFFHH